MSADGFASDLARELAPEALERFLRYVRIDTQSDPTSSSYPTTAKQLDLSRLLVQELLELGLADAQLTADGYVFATLPATPGAPAGTPVVGLLAHVDTSDAVSGANVQPQVHEGYDGGRLVLPADPSALLDPSTSPALARHVGHTIVTSDGSTLLGADDKAGVAEIMAAAAHLQRHPELVHGTVRIAFTVDEEVGRGVERFSLEEFGADVAYTLDGSGTGVIEDETFSAKQVVIAIRGNYGHTGSAKGRRVNPIKLPARLLERVPREIDAQDRQVRRELRHPAEEGRRPAREVEHAIVRPQPLPDRGKVRRVLRCLGPSQLVPTSAPPRHRERVSRSLRRHLLVGVHQVEHPVARAIGSAAGLAGDARVRCGELPAAAGTGQPAHHHLFHLPIIPDLAAIIEPAPTSNPIRKERT